MTIACPRHGVQNAAADTPCPHCGVALYDLSDRNARDVVRANRDDVLKRRRVAFDVVMVVVSVLFSLRNSTDTSLTIDFISLIVGIVIAIPLAAPFARAIERSSSLRLLDRYFVQQRI